MPETRDNPERGTAAVVRALLELDRMLVNSPGWEKARVEGSAQPDFPHGLAPPGAATLRRHTSGL